MDYQAQTERFIRSEEPEGGFVNAMARGVDSAQMAGYGFVKAVGDYQGEDWISRWAKKGIDRNLQEILSNPAKVHSWDDVDSLADFGTYFIETIGEQVPQLLFLPKVKIQQSCGNSSRFQHHLETGRGIGLD